MVFSKGPNARHSERGVKKQKESFGIWYYSLKIQNASNKNAITSHWQRAREKLSLKYTGMINSCNTSEQKQQKQRENQQRQEVESKIWDLRI